MSCGRARNSRILGGFLQLVERQLLPPDHVELGNAVICGHALSWLWSQMLRTDLWHISFVPGSWAFTGMTEEFQ